MSFGKLGVGALRHTYAVVVLTVLFIITRLFLFTGFPFSMNFLKIGMQLLDPAQLKMHLAGALFYQHIQPPLFNAMVGGILQLAPKEGTALTVFAFLYAVTGLLLVIGVYALAVNLGAGRVWSFVSAAVYTFWPPNILEQVFNHPPPEKWLSYDYPVMLFLLAMTLCMAMFRNSGKPRWLAGFLLLSAAIVWTRPFFHSLWWFVPTMILVILAMRRLIKAERLGLMAVAVLALGLSLAPAVKNQILYGWFTDSSFKGMNMASRILFLSPEVIKGEVDRGTITPLALIPRFSEPEVYLDYYGETELTGNALLDRVDKSTGHPNWNHFITIRASREYGANTRALIKAHPVELVKTTLNGIYIFFGFESHQFLWPLGSDPWGFWDVDFVPVRIEGFGSLLRFVGVPIIFAIVFFTVMYQMYRGRGDPLFLFILFLMAYTFAVSNIAELGHNNLFRKQVDPMLFAGAALWLTRFWQGRGGTRAPLPGPGEPDRSSGGQVSPVHGQPAAPFLQEEQNGETESGSNHPDGPVA